MKAKVLITVKTYPIPSASYDELVCTAGVTESGEFIRLYPINFRELDFDRQYRKYQWIEIDVEKHVGRDARKESYRPKSDTLQVLGEPHSTIYECGGYHRNPTRWQIRSDGPHLGS